MDSRTIGAIVVAAGLLAVAIGLLAMTGALDWFGRLPGDVRIEGGRTRVFVPITTMILVSVALTVILALLRRLL